MADKPLKWKALRAILKRYNVREEPSRGKGSHTLLARDFPEGTFTYPVPTGGACKHQVLVCYVKGLRKRFRLRPEDGVSDAEFYGK
jgi:hypothetical protein